MRVGTYNLFFWRGEGGQYVHVRGVCALNAYIALVFIDQEIIHTKTVPHYVILYINIGRNKINSWLNA